MMHGPINITSSPTVGKNFVSFSGDYSEDGSSTFFQSFCKFQALGGGMFHKAVIFNLREYT